MSTFRPRLLGALEPVSAKGRLFLLSPHLDSDLELAGAPTGSLALMRMLDGERDMPQLVRDAARHGLDECSVRELVAELRDAHLIEDAAEYQRLSALERERFDRQLRYFAGCLAPRPRAQAQLALRDASVAVLGLGGLGGLTALFLAACGVGKIVGVDDDVVEHSNLARQVLYDTHDVGMLKTVAAERTLRAIAPHLRFKPIAQRLRSAEDVSKAIEGTDIVVSAVDWPAHSIGQLVDEACFAARTPYVAMSQHPPKVRVGPLYLPGVTGCYGCVQAAQRTDHPLAAEAAADAGDVSPAATFAPACGLIASLIANDVIALLAGLHRPATLGRSWLFDLRSYEAEWLEVLGRATCQRCAAPRGAVATIRPRG